MLRKLLRKLIKTDANGEPMLCWPCAIGAVAVLATAIVAIILIVRSGGSVEEPEVLDQAFVNEVVQHGQIILTERINAGEDLSAGPCLDNGDTYGGWVIDIAHDPRTPEDDNPDNQCSAYRNGDAERFVELSLSGDIIRIHPPVTTLVPEEQQPGEPVYPPTEPLSTPQEPQSPTAAPEEEPESDGEVAEPETEPED
jgi:hypothetical protein